MTHPATALDEQGRIHGHLDPPLSHAGRIHARKIALGFKGKKVNTVHSSPRLRARETADMIAHVTGAAVRVHKELEPWNLAKMSGAKTASIKPLLDFFSARPNRVIPGGESKNSVLARYRKFSETLKPGDVLVGHSQHSLAWDYAKGKGDAAKVPMIGGKAGEVKQVSL